MVAKVKENSGRSLREPTFTNTSNSNRPTSLLADIKNLTLRPTVAILREQGVNGQMEMGWAFSRVSSDVFDVHMSDMFSGEVTSSALRGFVACPGISYRDLLGAGGQGEGGRGMEWLDFEWNRFEGRVAMVEIVEVPFTDSSVIFEGMEGIQFAYTSYSPLANMRK